MSARRTILYSWRIDLWFCETYMDDHHTTLTYFTRNISTLIHTIFKWLPHLIPKQTTKICLHRVTYCTKYKIIEVVVLIFYAASTLLSLYFLNFRLVFLHYTYIHKVFFNVIITTTCTPWSLLVSPNNYCPASGWCGGSRCW